MLVMIENPCSRLKPIATQGQKRRLCSDRETSITDPICSAYLGTMSRHGGPYRDTKSNSFVARAYSLCAPRSSRAPSLRTWSRHEKPCRGTGPEKPYRDREFSMSTQTWKFAVAFPGLFYTSKLFFFFSFQNTLNSI